MITRRLSRQVCQCLLSGAIACAQIVSCSAAGAQTADRGAIQGTLLDPIGRPVGAATVELTDPATGATRQVASDRQGLFQFTALAPGSYVLRATAPSFATWETTAVVSVGSVTGVRATLPLGATSEVVHVRETAPVLDTATVAVSTTIDSGAVHNLPSPSRKASDFALLTPTVTPNAAADGQLSFRGIGTLLNNNMVDGADDNQAFFSEERGRTTVAYTNSEAAVEEFQVNTSNYGAQYGRAAGGVINTVTRSGGNAVHGRAFFYDRNSAWGASNAFAKTTALVAGSTTSTTTEIPVHQLDTVLQAGASLSGPLIHNRVFGIVTYDSYHRDFPGIARTSNPAKFFLTPTQQAVQLLAARQNLLPAQALTAYNSVLSGLGSLLGDVPRTADESTVFPKVDWQVDDRDHVTAEWNRMRWNSPNGVQSSPTATYGSSSFGNSVVADDTTIARWSRFLSPNLLNELTFQYDRDLESETSNPPSAFESTLAENIYGRPPQIYIEDYGFRFGNPPVLNRAAYPDERRIEAGDSLTWVHGRHTVKSGYSLEFVNDYSDALYNANGTYVYTDVMQFVTDYLKPDTCDASSSAAGVLPCYAYYTQGFGPTTFQFQSADYAGFLSDEWKVRPGLTLSLGLRYEYEQLPDTNLSLVNADIPQTAKLPHDKNNFGPRVGFAWDIGGGGDTVLRAGYGIYYGRIINATAYSALTETGAHDAQRSYQYTPLSTGTPPFPYVFSSTPYLSVAPSAVYFDSGFQNPEIEQSEVSLEQRIGRDTSLTFTGMVSLGRELPNYVDANIDLSSAQSLTYAVIDPLRQGPLPATYTTRFYTARINPNYGPITRIFSETNSKYEAGVLRVDHRLTRALDLHASFTYAHAMDWNQNATAFADTNDVLDPANLALEYGNSNYDIRRRLTGGLVLQAPWRVHSFTGAVVNGWELAPTGELRDGLPFSMQTSGSIPYVAYENGLGSNEKLIGLGASLNGSGGDPRIDVVGRNTFRYPAAVDMNLRVSKRTQLTHGATLEVLGECFNVLNHENLTSLETTGYSVANSSTLGEGPKLTWESGTAANSTAFDSPLNGNNTNIYMDRKIQVSTRLSF